MSKARSDWAWKPEDKDVPALKFETSKKPKKSRRNKKRKQKVTKRNNESFYNSDEWRQLRVRVLQKYECKCMMCGRSPKDDGVKIHVDHIKPRSKYPHLSLVFENLQLLCDDCNIGKLNKFETDYRPDSENESLEDLDRKLLLEANKYI